ncbi:MAG: class I SAM-dependent methyltransferase [Pseudomonadota bacterium]
MGTLAENRAYYAEYDWRFGGAEWSAAWGTTEAMWNHTLRPRLARWLPAGTVVEIGAGCGRIAQFLLPEADYELHLFDIMPPMVERCAKAFRHEPKIRSELTDGMSLPGLADGSVDLVLSFYSLVHSDGPTIDAYLSEIARVLKPQGVAFMHHSNAGIYYDEAKANVDRRMQLLEKYRDVTLSAARFRELAAGHELKCVEQECVNWDVEQSLTDCFSTVAKAESAYDEMDRARMNLGFRAEMRRAAKTVRRRARPSSQRGG